MGEESDDIDLTASFEIEPPARKAWSSPRPEAGNRAQLADP